MEAHFIKISPVKDGIKRPLWSVVIPTFNCAEFLKETLQSVLLQDPGEDQMEIIVVDDHSTKDNPESVVEQYGKGRVQFYRQPKNMGKSQNYEVGISKTKGHYVHLLHGDDTVENGFYKKIEQLLIEFPSVSVAFCQCNYINEIRNVIGETELLVKNKSLLPEFIKKIAVWQCIQPPSIVFKREVYEQVGTYDKRLKYIEDWEFYVRSALHFEFAYLPEKLANYRVFANNSSNQSVKGGQRVSTIDQVITIIDSYLHEDIKKQIQQPRREAVALYMLNFIPKVVATKDLKGFIVFSKAFFRYNRSLRLFGRWLRFIVQYKKFT